MDSRLSFLLEHSNDIFCAFDLNGNIIASNASFRHFTDYSEQEILSKNILDILHPDDSGRNIELLKNIASEKNIAGYKSRISNSDDTILNVNWTMSFNEGDGFVYATGIYLDEKLNIRSSQNISAKIQHVLADLSEGFFILDENWRINAFNPAFLELVNISQNELHGADFKLLNNLIIADEVIPEFESAFKSNEPSQIQYYHPLYKGWLRLNIYPYKGEVIAFIRDISNIRIQQLVLALEKKVLELNLLPAYSLSQITDELLAGIESIFPEMYCSILAIDEVQKKVYHLSAPRLPEEYCVAINGAKIGPKAGSCGTAAYNRKQIIVSDIANDPLWEDYKRFILPYGFKACWSTPVIGSPGNNVLATFAIYYTTIREPSTEELQMIERTINILRVLIESKKSNERMAEQNKRLQDIAAISSHNIRRPVATIMGLVNLFDGKKIDNPLNKEIMDHIETTAIELDEVIHIIVEKTINI